MTEELRINVSLLVRGGGGGGEQGAQLHQLTAPLSEAGPGAREESEWLTLMKALKRLSLVRRSL